MPSVTSFFSRTLYAKNLNRFWPLWALYGIVWIYTIPLSLLNMFLADRNHPDRLIYQFEMLPAEAGSLGLGLAVVFGIFSAMAVFSYLYNHRSACAMHALPLRREALFLTSYLAGLSFLILPNAIVAVLTVVTGFIAGVSAALVLQMTWIWFLVQSASCLFFYSFGVFCAMFTGHILALPAFYGILNGLVWGIQFLIRALCENFLNGFVRLSDSVMSTALVLTPVLNLANAEQWEVISSGGGGLNEPLTILGYVIAGLVMTVISLEVYRFRHVESAGDVVAIPLVRPVFKYGLSFCAGLAFGMVTAAFFTLNESVSLTVFILLWTVIGYFVAEMFLRKSFRVMGAWKGAVVMAAVMAVLCMAFIQDWMGFEHRIPAAADVDYVCMNLDITAPYDSAYSNQTIQFHDPERVAEVIAAHEAAIDESFDSNMYDSRIYDDVENLTFDYQLKNGRTMHRRYNVPLRESDLNQQGTLTWCLNQMIQDRDLMEEYYGFDRYENGTLISAYLQGVWNKDQNAEDYQPHYIDATPSELMDLWRAVREDYDEGNIGVRYLLKDSDTRYENTYVTDLYFEWDPAPIDSSDNQDASGEDSFSYSTSSTISTNSSSFLITLTPQATHTLAWLESHGVPNESFDFLTHLQHGSWKPETSRTIR